MTTKFKILVGVCALVLAIAFNTRHALNGYGIKEINLNVEALETSVYCFNHVYFSSDGYSWYMEPIYCGGCVKVKAVEMEDVDTCSPD